MVTEGGDTRLTGLLLALTLGVLGRTSGHGDSVCAKGSKIPGRYRGREIKGKRPIGQLS